MQYIVALLPALFRWLVSYAIAKFFISLAVGIFTYSIIQYFFDKYINAAMQQLNYIGDVANFMAIARLDTAISIVIGAMSIRAFMQATKVVLGKQG